MTKTRNEKVEVTIDFTEIKQILREYCGQLYSSKLDNLDQMGNFLETETTRADSRGNRKFEQTCSNKEIEFIPKKYACACVCTHTHK